MKLGGVKGSSSEMTSSTEAWDMLPSCGKVSDVFLSCGGNPKINLPVTKESNDALRCNSPRFTAVYALPQTHMAPQNWWFGDYFPLGRPIFRGYVSFRECNSNFSKSKFSIQIFLGKISQKKRFTKHLQLQKLSDSLLLLNVLVLTQVWTITLT